MPEITVCSAVGAAGWLLALWLLHQFWSLRHLMDMEKRIGVMERAVNAVASIDEAAFADQSGDKAVAAVKSLMRSAVVEEPAP